jgi:hypothetical protein
VIKKVVGVFVRFRAAASELEQREEENVLQTIGKKNIFNYNSSRFYFFIAIYHHFNH